MKIKFDYENSVNVKAGRRGSTNHIILLLTSFSALKTETHNFKHHSNFFCISNQLSVNCSVEINFLGFPNIPNFVFNDLNLAKSSYLLFCTFYKAITGITDCNLIHKKI